MRIPKKYGESRNDKCIFCDAQATTENSQGLLSCPKCKSKTMEDKRCVCGEYLDIKKSKWGAFFLCHKCGPISISKAMNMGSSGFKLNKKYREPEKKPKYEDRLYTIQELERMWD